MSKRTNGPSAAVRLRVITRDRHQCIYCGMPGTDAELQVDHIVPVAKGGSHHIANLATACRSCNQRKGDRRAPRRAASTAATAADLIRRATDAGIDLSVANDRINYEAPETAEADAILADIAAHRDAVLACLRSQTALQ